MTLPNFLIIGVMKSGTTSLYEYLKQHSQIYMSPVKEPFFFCADELRRFNGAPKSRTTPGLTPEAYRALFDGVNVEGAIGEASAVYLYLPRTAKNIREQLPNAKLIAILRHPAERAYSHYLMGRMRGTEPLKTFEQALAAEPARVHENWALDWRYKDIGYYARQLSRYYQIFPRERLRVYLYDELAADAIGVVQDICNFLDVDDTFVPNVEHRHNASGLAHSRRLHRLLIAENPVRRALRYVVPPRVRRPIRLALIRHNFSKPSLSPELRAQLTADYRDDILRLQDLIQRDLSHWLK